MSMSDSSWRTPGANGRETLDIVVNAANLKSHGSAILEEEATASIVTAICGEVRCLYRRT